MNGMGDPNSLWVVRGPHGSHCPQVLLIIMLIMMLIMIIVVIITRTRMMKSNTPPPTRHRDSMQGTAVKNGQVVRLTHLKTQRNLHTAHIRKCPLHSD
jgi:hypothetical protein